MKTDKDYIPSGDTMRTYCIEGTPFSCSSAASLTDLREAGIEGSKAEEEATEIQVSFLRYFLRYSSSFHKHLNEHFSAFI